MKREIRTKFLDTEFELVTTTKWGKFINYILKIYPILIFAGITLFFLVQKNNNLKHDIEINNQLIATFQEKLDSLLAMNITKSFINLENENTILKNDLENLKFDNDELRRIIQKSQLYIREITTYYEINDRILLRNRIFNIFIDILIGLITGILVIKIQKRIIK